MRHASFRAVSPTGLVVDTVITESDRIMINTHPAAQAAACPGCGIASAKVHSHYVRRLLDLPSHGRAVHLRVQVRRFRCSNRNCQRRIFGEPLPDTTALRGARRTSRLEVIVHHLGVALGGRPGASLARRLMLPVSKDTCHKMRGRNGSFHYYYYCRNHDPLRAGGEHRRCPERNVRAGELDAFVFDQVRATMLRPDVLLAGEAAVSTRREAGSDELLATQLASLDRKINAVDAERRRLADLYQASFIEREELLRRGKELELRRSALNAQRQALIDQREELAQQNRLRDRVEGFARRVQATIDRLDFAQRQSLLRLVIDEVRVSGWLVEIRFRIPLDNPPEPPNTRVSTKNRLRSLHKWLGRVIPRSHYRSLQELEMAPWHPMISDVVSAPSSGGHRGSAMCRHYASSSMTWRAIRRSAVPRPSVNWSYTLVSTCRAWSRCPLSANN